MLVNLDNEVHFKKVFTDVEVFTAFVKDVLGIDIHITKVETEKVLLNKVSAIKFRMDLFAEDTDNRTIVEIQKVDYDYSFDRFTHYFIGNLIDMQRSSKTYTFAKEVYIIVVVTAAYRISDKNGKPIKDDVLITDVNPRTLQGEVRDMYNHKMVILNTINVSSDTPPEIRDWLDLIIQSMQNPENPIINTLKPAIVKAAHLAELDNIDPEELAEAKIQEMRKEFVAIVEDTAETRVKNEGIKKALKQGKLSKTDIAELFDVTIEYIQHIENQLKDTH